MARSRRKPPSRLAGNDRAHNPPKPPPRPKHAQSPDDRAVARGSDFERRRRERAARSGAGAAHVAADAGSRQYAGPSPQIVSRQRTLRAAGFPVVVDGTWGPRSQIAWQQYQRGSRPVHDAQVRARVEAERAAARLKFRQERKIEQVAATVQGERDRERIVAAQLRRAFEKHLQHGVSPEDRRGSDFQHVQNRQLERVALRRERVRINQIAKRARAKRPEDLTLDELVALNFDPTTGDFNPQKSGDVTTVQRWLRAHGHPKLAVDGTFGRETFKALSVSYSKAKKQHDDAAKAALVQQLYRIQAVRPGEAFPILGHAPTEGELLGILREGGFGASMIWRNLLQVAKDRHLEFLAYREQTAFKLGQEAFGPFFDKLVATDARQTLRSVQLIAPSPADQQSLDAFQTSRDFGEFKRKLVAFEQEATRLREKQLRESQDHAWWQSALDYALVKPGELFRDELVTSVQGSIDFLTDLDIDTHNPEERRARANAWQAQFARNHPWQNLAFVLAADPLWVAPGAGKVLNVGAQAVLRLERAGYAIERSGKLVQSARLAPLAKSGLALRVPAMTGRAIDRFDTHLSDAIMTMPTVVPLHHFARQLTRLKSEAVALARRDANHQLARNFADSEVSAVVRAQIDELAPEMDAHVEYLMPEIIRALVDANASLYVHETDRELSNIGAMLLGNGKEVARVHAIEMLAVRDARAAYENAIARGESVEQATEDLRHAYSKIKWGAGFHVVGMPDAWIGRRIAEIADTIQAQFEHTVLPAIQRRLEAAAEARGESLFEKETGLWVGRQGYAAETLRRFGAEAYDTLKTISARNPLFKKVFSIEERDALISEEVARRAGLVKSWFIREGAAGRPRPSEWLDERVQEINDEVTKAWRPTPGGFEDTRELLKVPVVNARHVASVYGAALKGEHPLLSVDDAPAEALDLLKQMAEHPAAALDGPVQNELTNLSWALDTPENLAEMEPVLGEFLRQLRPHEFDIEAAGRFQETVGKMAATLAQGYGEILPAALRKHFALWQAWAEAQGFWARNSYRVVQGGLNHWIFATLTLRPGWAARNVVDNTAKLLTAGVRDPRYYFLGALEPGAKFRSVFEANLRDVRFVAERMDAIFKTNVAHGLDSLMEAFWEHSSPVLSRIFRAHNIPTPENVFEHGLHRPHETLRVAKPKLVRMAEKEPKAGRAERLAGKAGEGLRSVNREATAVDVERLGRAVSNFREVAWELMATKPESASKRIGYRWKYFQVLKETGDESLAFTEAVEFVEKHLFDYSKVSVLEDNLRFIFPFVQFWRKNTALWAENFVNKPWLPAGLVNFEDQLKDNVHADLPEWTRRYIHANELGDGIGKIPGLGWLGNYVSGADAMYDPLNFFSFAPMYRAFKNENLLLPADKAGIPFLAPMVDAMNDWGLSMNPLVRKPLEAFGVFNYRAWQSIFPQTPIVQALTRKYFNERWPNGLNLEAIVLDPIFKDLLGKPGTNELIANSFNQYVQLEMANQAARGEPVSRAAAEKKIQDFFLVQTVFSYFVGVYARRMTPQDFQLYGILDGLREGTTSFGELTPEEQKAYKLFRLRKIDKPEFDRYVSLIPLIEAYYAQGSYQAKERMKLDHPEILPWVEPFWAGKGIPSSYVQTAALVQDTSIVVAFADLGDQLDLPDDVRAAGMAALVHPSLLKFWDDTRTALKWRDRHLRLAYFRHIQRLNDTFYAIPEDDHKARDGFLAQHPILVHSWRQKNDAADDYLAIINGANADLREAYFEHVDAGDWASAGAFLHRYPFIFEFTTAASRVDDDGNWISKLGSAGSGGRRFRHFRRGGQSAHARDYLQMKPLLDKFFGMKDEFRKQAWLEHDGPEQKAVLAYFRKWGSKDGNSEHARAFQEAKPSLDIYFGLPKPQRKEWLNGNSKDAKVALAFFKRWSKLNQMARLWAKKPQSKNPELQLRLEFWHRYFTLLPDERPLFALREAEKHGVFIYGPLSAKERHQRESDYLRKVYAFGASKKAAMYLYVQPLLDEFGKLDRKDKQLFLKANPELGEYLDEFSNGSASGDPKLDKLIASYFKLDQESPERSAFLRAHPEVQRYFDKHSTPAEAAMRRLLQIYFRQPPVSRKKFLWAHPEIRAYFDKRRLEKDNERAQLDVFGEVDPRLQRFWKLAVSDITAPAEAIHQREQDQGNRHLLANDLERRVDRRRR